MSSIVLSHCEGRRKSKNRLSLNMETNLLLKGVSLLCVLYVLWHIEKRKKKFCM